MVSLCQMGVKVITLKKAITVSIITTLQRVFSLFCISSWQSCCPDQKRGQGWYWRSWLERVALQHRLAAACFSIRRKRSRRAGQSTYAGSRGRYIYICDLGMLWCILTEVYVRSLVWYVLVQNGIKSGTYVCNVHICTGFYTLNITMYVTHFCIYKLNLLRYFQVLHSGLEPQSINQLPHRPKDLLTEEFVFLSWSQKIRITCLFIFKLIPLC